MTPGVATQVSLRAGDGLGGRTGRRSGHRGRQPEELPGLVSSARENINDNVDCLDMPDSGSAT